MKNKYFIFDDDLRFHHLAHILRENQQQVSTFSHSTHPFEELEQANVIIMPIRINSISVNDFIKHLRPGQKLFGINITNDIISFCQENKINCIDFMKSETVARENAISTAEGAIAEAISLSEQNIHGSHCLVLGYGKCGSALAHVLLALSGSVTVAARNPDQRHSAHSQGCNTVKLQDICEILPTQDFIFNTIPAPILMTKELSLLSPDSIIIDIASSPGGTDFTQCEVLGIKAKLALALPGKYSPKTSAEILARYICNH